MSTAILERPPVLTTDSDECHTMYVVTAENSARHYVCILILWADDIAECEQIARNHFLNVEHMGTPTKIVCNKLSQDIEDIGITSNDEDLQQALDACKA